ncbi:chaperone modulator CbpM [Flagellimonas marinaquae]|uniref:chaperone modulator CbpM n=1 Tax=Flagellimonas marinaquae TaxID=254955 RepID=UPI00207578D9|nr:chaperone modulator CbpM [Allomuricauda aquimarina]USD24515.1 chaperone modulator CbpM [Allomuricauda aquimarina]
MKKENFISIKTFCENHGVGESFIYSMYEYEILQVQQEKEAGMLHLDDLPLLEKMVRLHHDLDINPEGIQAVHHLLGQVESLQQEVASLKKKLDRLE